MKITVELPISVEDLLAVLQGLPRRLPPDEPNATQAVRSFCVTKKYDTLIITDEPDEDGDQ